MKRFILSLTLACFTVWQAQAQIKGIVPPEGVTFNYETKHLLNGTNDGKIKTIELPQINEGFDKKTYDEALIKYLYAVGDLKQAGWKANMLGVLLIENGMIYFYNAITPEGKKEVRYGVRLLREVDGTNENCHYTAYLPGICSPRNDKDYVTESVVIKVKSAGKKPSFTITTKNNVGTFVTTYKFLPAEADTNSKWITVL